MSQLKYFYIFPLAPSRNALNVLSLKNASVISTFIPVCLFSFLFVIDLFSHDDNIIILIFKHVTYSICNFISFVYIVKSLHQFEYKKAYIGNMSLIFAFGLHLVLFIINSLFNISISPIKMGFVSHFVSTNLYRFASFTLPNFLYIVFELCSTWFVYSYARNLSEGNDALVDGQNFDRYIEDFGSDNGSVSDRRGRINSNSNNFNSNFNSERNENKNSESFDSGNGGKNNLVQSEMF